MNEESKIPGSQTERTPGGVALQADKYMKALNIAVRKVKAKIKPIAKSAFNPHFKSRYTPLDDIQKALLPLTDAEKLNVYFYNIVDGDRAGVSMVIRHDDGGVMDCGALLLPIGRTGGPQGVISAISYAKRTQLSSVFNLILGEDDDGNAAQGSHDRPVDTRSRDDVPSIPKSKTAQKREIAASNKKAEQAAAEPDVLDLKAQSAIQAALKTLADEKGIDKVHEILGAFENKALGIEKVEKVAQLPPDCMGKMLDLISEAKK